MDFIDIKFINLISSRLQRFKRVKPHLYNFRCPYCGDSQKNKSKARGYFYRIKTNTNFKCHNCGLNVSFNSFLKDLDPVTHKEYVFEKFKEGHIGKNFVHETPESLVEKAMESKPVFKKRVKVDLPNAFDVNVSKIYLHGRAIFEGEFYYTDNFKEFANTIRPGTFESTKYGEERIVIPLKRDGKLIGVQGRALSSNPIKYITVMIDDEQPKIYGLDSINPDLPVYVVEGPLDSTFLDNSVALCGSDGDVGCLEGSDLTPKINPAQPIVVLLKSFSLSHKVNALPINTQGNPLINPKRKILNILLSMYGEKEFINFIFNFSKKKGRLQSNATSPRLACVSRFCSGRFCAAAG